MTTKPTRWAPAAGIGSAVLMLYALLGPPSPPAADAAPEIWRAQLADPANRLWLIAATIAATVAALLFLGFMAALRQRGVLGPVVGYGSGLLFVGCLLATFAVWVSVPAGIQISAEPVPDGDLIRFLNDLGQAFLAIPAPLCAGVFAVAVARSTGAPRWLAASGYVVGVVQLVGILYFPFLLFPVWVGAVSLALLRRPAPVGDRQALAAVAR
jgi:hypothetical protein